MTERTATFGIIGGTGMLGRAMALGILKSGALPPDRVWLSNRSGAAPGFEAFEGVHVTSDNRALAQACDVILLCVPPALVENIGIFVPGKLVMSVMAGVSLERLQDLTGASRVARAMSSPAAEMQLAYSPWFGSDALTEEDRALVTALLEGCGQTDEVNEEDQIDLFTALTGPVPGFVAYFADCMAGYAEARGLPPQIADRAMRQLFRASGRVMADGTMRPADYVREMIDYAGTTAAGLVAMQALPIREDIAKGLDAAVARTKTIG